MFFRSTNQGRKNCTCERMLFLKKLFESVEKFIFTPPCKKFVFALKIKNQVSNGKYSLLNDTL